MSSSRKRATPDDESDNESSPTGDATSISPGTSFSSDKENRTGSSRNALGKTARSMPGADSNASSMASNKRRRLADRGAPDASQTALRKELDYIDDKEFYDPEQPIAERRAVRKGIRDLARNLHESKQEFIQPESTGIADTVGKANEIYAKVKQTADAVLDSRLLVTAGDLGARRAIQNKLGNTTRGVDVDDFVSKCLSFMRKTPSDESNSQPSTQSRRRKRDADPDDSDGSADEGDAYNWAGLGRRVAFPNNVRPPVPGFLLGPLSVQKRARKQTQRTQRAKKRDPADAVQPDELKLKDIEKAENSNLTALCRKIFELLVVTHKTGTNKVNAKLQEMGDDMTDEIYSKLLEKTSMSANDGIDLVRFAFNPKSFGQTVENLFYISFLIRDGKVGMDQDDSGVITLHFGGPKPNGEGEGGEANGKEDKTKKQAVVKRQAIFHLDFEDWEDACQTLNIKSCVIPHRESDQEGQTISATGWYG